MLNHICIFSDMQFEETRKETPGRQSWSEAQPWKPRHTQWKKQQKITMFSLSHAIWRNTVKHTVKHLGGNLGPKHIPERPPHTPPQAHTVFDSRRNSRRSPENYNRSPENWNRNPENHNRTLENYNRSPENYCHTFKEFSNPENYCHTMKAQRIFHLHWVDLFHMKLFLS